MFSLFLYMFHSCKVQFIIIRKSNGLCPAVVNVLFISLGQKYEENDNIVVMTSVDTDVVTMKGKPLEIGCESIQNTITKHQNIMFYR